jgi:hypothetical protein
LHVIAAEQAQLHAKLRDTYVLKAYKGALVLIHGLQVCLLCCA